MRAAQTVGVRVIREADERDVRIGVGDVVGIDASDVGDHDVGPLDPVSRLETMLREERLEFASEEHSTPHSRIVAIPMSDDSTVDAEYKRGLALSRRGEYFAAHEAFEGAWRAATA